MAEKKFIIEVRTKGFARATKDFKQINTRSRQYEQTTNRLRKSTRGLERVFGTLRNRLLVGAFGFGIITKAAQLFFRSSIQFEDVKTRLIGLTGSVEDAQFAFEKFSNVAATTPFQLDDVVNAGAQLNAFGASANETIKPITDLAAFMGTTATEAANAFGRAYAGGAGAADILREKGVLNIIKDFKGIEDITDLTLPQFRQAMIDAFVDPEIGIAGSADRLSKTVRGAFSNMLDAVTRLSAELSGPYLSSLQGAIQGTTNFLNETIDFIRFTRKGRENFETFGEAVDAFSLRIRNTKDLKELNNELERLKTQMELAQQPVVVLETEIVGLSPSIKRTKDNLKIFTDEAQEGFKNLEAITPGVAVFEGVLGNLTEAIQKQNEAQAITGTGTLSLAEKIKILQARIDELNEEERERLNIMNDIDLEERLREERILALASLEKQRQEEIARANALLDDQIIRMENAAMKTAGMTDEFSDTTNKAQLAAGAINGLGNAMNIMSQETDNAGQRMQQFLQVAGALLVVFGGTAGSVGSILAAIGSIPIPSSNIAHTGGLITNRGVQRFANGGVVQGQDNVPILAQAGEFVMRRDAVQNIGLDNLTSMNRTGNAGGVTINISGNMVANESFVRDTLIPEIQKVSNEGLA
tara:strand:- start:4148 stop:6073 length:1926 start_codon:yes stop_codon:yes gene_type:complete